MSFAFQQQFQPLRSSCNLLLSRSFYLPWMKDSVRTGTEDWTHHLKSTFLSFLHLSLANATAVWEFPESSEEFLQRSSSFLFIVTSLLFVDWTIPPPSLHISWLGDLVEKIWMLWFCHLYWHILNSNVKNPTVDSSICDRATFQRWQCAIIPHLCFMLLPRG